MKKKFICTMAAATALAAGMAFSAAAADFTKVQTYTPGQFTDVNASEWYAGAVSSSYELGLMKGTADGVFSPEGTMTVAEAVTIAARVHDAYHANGTSFAQTGANWYDDYVAYAVKNGIIAEGRFGEYDRPAKRSEMAEIFAAAVPENFLSAKNNVNEIPDVPESNSYYDRLLLLYNAGVIMGNDEFGTFKPENNVTRAEAAAIIGRVALPESRLQKTLVDANFDDAYYLINDGSVRFTPGLTQSVSPWNYDNRNRFAAVSNSADHVADYYKDGVVELWRDVDDVSRGLVGWDFFGSIQIVSDGTYFMLTDDNKNAVASLHIKNGNWYVNDADTGRKASTGSLYFSLQADLDNHTASLVLNGTQLGKTFPIADLTVSRVYIGSGKETMTSINTVRCDVYKDYLVNEIFLQPVNSELAQWEVTGNAKIVVKGGQGYNDVNSAELPSGTVAKKSFRPISGKVVYEAYMLFPTDSDVGYITLNSGETVAARMNLTSDGVFKADGTKLRHRTANVWQYLRIEADTTTDTAVYKINGKIVGEFPLDAAVSTVDTIKVGATGGTVYFDDVKVFLTHEYDDYCPEPQPITDDGYDVLMNVCSLWREGSHSGWGCESGYPDIEPALGYYDEGLVEVADWEIKFMVENGVDVQHLCWYCPSSDIKEPIKRSNLSWALHDGYFNAKYADKMKFTFMWENNGVNCKSLDQFKEYIWKYWVEYYFTDDRFYTIDNKLVFTVWNYGNFKKAFGDTYEGCTEAVNFMNEDVKQYGYDGVMIFFADQHRQDAASFENMTNMGATGAYAYHWSQDGNSAEKSIERLQKNQDFGKIHIVPTVSVGFNNLGWSGVRKPMISLADHKKVLEYIKNDYLTKESGWKAKTLIISTWNEFGEGTYVFPCKGLHGFGYLENIAEVISGTTDHANNIYPTQQQKARLCHLYPESKTTLAKFDLERENETIVPGKTVATYTGADMKSLFGLDSESIEGTVFKGTTSKTDSGIVLADNKKPSVAASDVSVIRVTMKSSVACTAELFFATDSSPITADTRYGFAIEATEDFKEYTIYTASNAKWSGTIKDLRIDALSKPGSFEFAKCELLGASEEQKPITLTVDGKKCELSFAPVEKNGELYVVAEPYAGFFSLHNFYFEWSRYTGKLYILTKNNRTAEFVVGSDTALVDGAVTKLSEPVVLRDGLPVLPLYFLYNIAGIEYEVNGKNVQAYVSGKEYMDIINSRVPYEYEFEIPGDNEGFSAADGTLVVYGGFFSGEALKRDSQNPPYDPRYTLSGLNVPTASYKKIVIGMKHKLEPGVTSSKTEVFFITSSDASWNQNKAHSVELRGAQSEEIVEYTIDFSSNPGWKDSVTAIRFDPISCGGSYDIDYIRFVGDGSATLTEEQKPQTPEFPAVENLVNGDAEDTKNVAFFNEPAKSKIEIVKDEESGSNVYRNLANTGYNYTRQSVHYDADTTYSVSVDVKILGTKSGKTDVGTTFHCNARYTDAEGKWDHIVNSKKIAPADGWQTVTFTFAIPAGIVPDAKDEFSFFTNPADGEGFNYMIDNVKVTKVK